MSESIKPKKTSTKKNVKEKTAQKKRVVDNDKNEPKGKIVKKKKTTIKKKITKETPKREKVIKKVEKKEYYEAIGRRKTASAQVRIWTQGQKEIIVNNKPYKIYFPTIELQETAISSLDKMKCLNRFKISVIVKGGGIQAQAVSVRHGIARVLVILNPDFRKRLKKAGLLTRDPRMRERKKFGLKRARRAPQWRKR
ncbi:MAG: 30S ribosomal protein S9 [Patescibacteria group bacterium]|nr:30S ribosomal protein S9 [Patescibacteria group bacterium]